MKPTKPAHAKEIRTYSSSTDNHAHIHSLGNTAWISKLYPSFCLDPWSWMPWHTECPMKDEEVTNTSEKLKTRTKAQRATLPWSQCLTLYSVLRERHARDLKVSNEDGCIAELRGRLSVTIFDVVPEET